MGESMCPRSIPLDTAVSAAASPAISAASEQNYGDGHLHADSPSLLDTDDDNGGHSHDDNNDDDGESDDYNHDYEDDHDDDASLSSCSSATSILTFVQQPISDDSNGYNNSNNDATVSMDTCWTDDKHSSYLSFMEATFVKNLYDREYCAPDLCGHAPHRLDMDEENSAESRFRLPTEFKACQNGDWYWRMISKPLIPASSPWALLANPWVKHFRPQSHSGNGNGLVRHFSDQKERGELEVQKCTGPLKSTQPGPDAERAVDVQQQERLDSHQSASSRVPVNGSLVQPPLQLAPSKLAQTTVSNARTRKRSLCGDQDERSIMRRLNGGQVQHRASEGFDQVSYDNNGLLPDGVSSSKQMQNTESQSDGKGVCSLPVIGPSESPASFPDNISLSVHIKENLRKSPLTSKPLCQLNKWGSPGLKRSL